MKQTRNFIIYDFETDGVDPNKCNGTELAAVAVDGRNLNILDDSEFNIVIRPDDIKNRDEYYREHKSTIDWHCKNRKCKTDELLDKWDAGIPEQIAWKQFHDYVNRYNWAGKAFTAPIRGGINVRNFDDIIYHRLNEKHKMSACFWKRDVVDLLDISFWFFENSENGPQDYKMDTLREFFGMGNANAHEALFDVKTEAALIIRYLKLCRKLSAQVKWK